MQVNEYAPVIAATIGWGIAVIVLAIQHHDMAARGGGWWLWVGVTGFGLGLWGLFLISMRHRGLRKAADRASHERNDAIE
jgi:hypothetical protein